MPLRISSGLTQLRRIKQVHRMKHPKKSSKMSGKYGIYRRSKRDSQSGPEQSTTVSVVYVTASPTFTGPIVGYMTSGPDVEKISGSDAATTSEMMSSAVNQTASTSSMFSASSASLQSSTVDEQTSTLTSTSTFTVTSSFATPSYSVSSISSSAIVSSTSATSTSTEASTSSQLEQEQSIATQSAQTSPLTTIKPLAMAVETPSPSPTSIVTSLKDLPMVIESPTSTVPISMPLLVATSPSSSNTFLATTSIEEPLVATPNSPAISTVNSESSTPKVSSNMGATGKASLIIGVVLLLGAVFMMLQVYLNKRRRSIVGEKLDDDEKGALRKMTTPSAMSPSIPSKLNPQTNTAQNNISHSNMQNSRATAAKVIPSPTASPTANPFGKHAEILVDSDNARKTQSIDRVVPNVEETPVNLVSVASEKGQPSPGFQSPSTDARLPNLKTDVEDPAPATAPTKNSNSSVRATNEPLSPVNCVYRVQIDFSPSMDDELELRAGQLIRLLHEYDDGWAMCVRLDCSRQGVCPRTCLSARPVKPRSSSGGPRGPPPAINVPMTPTSRPQSGARTNGPSSPAVAHFSTTTPRSPQRHESNGFHMHGPQKTNPSQDPFYSGQQVQRVGHPQVSKGAEVPIPLVLFPRAPPEIDSSRDFPSAASNNHSSVQSLTEGQTSTSLPRNSSQSITSPPECPGPMAPAHDYFSLNKQVTEYPPHIDASAAPSNITKAPMSPNVNQSNAEVGISAHSSHQNFDNINDSSIPGQAL